MPWAGRAQRPDEVGDGCLARRQIDLFLGRPDPLAQPGKIQHGERLAHHPTDISTYLGDVTVSIVPSEWMTVLVPLPFGTTIADPPPGVTVLW